ncbi:hypothetical protein HG531_005148 [Fusarium graminearum]|nr:hypothetical protein HG531_005148 [Fusarium graminearum]
MKGTHLQDLNSQHTAPDAYHSAQDVHLTCLDLDFLDGEEGAVDHDADQPFVSEELTLRADRALGVRHVHKDRGEVFLCRSPGLGIVLHIPD